MWWKWEICPLTKHEDHILFKKFQTQFLLFHETEDDQYVVIYLAHLCKRRTHRYTFEWSHMGFDPKMHCKLDSVFWTNIQMNWEHQDQCITQNRPMIKNNNNNSCNAQCTLHSLMSKTQIHNKTCRCLCNVYLPLSTFTAPQDRKQVLIWLMATWMLFLTCYADTTTSLAKPRFQKFWTLGSWCRIGYLWWNPSDSINKF